MINRTSCLLMLLLCIPLIGFGQDKGIQFQRGLNWKDIQTKAKAENKYIFMDLSATWCAPCKFMSNEVFPMQEVGKYINEKFLSIEVQADKTEKDGNEVKKWYEDADAIVKQYNVSNFPTYLFFSPDGQLVYKGSGALNHTDFLTKAADALRYAALLADYEKGKRDPAAMAFLARTAASNDEMALADTIASDYLRSLTETEFYTKDHLEFALQFTRSSKSKTFDLFYRHADEVNKVMGSGYAQGVVDNIVSVEEIDPILFPGGKKRAKDDPWKPDWNAITAAIATKYDAECADRSISDAKVVWYGSREDWIPDYLKSLVAVTERYLARKPDLTDLEPTMLSVNNPAYDIFEHSTDKAELNAAISWMARVLDENQKRNLDRAFYLDTYANLLYKVSRKEDAAKWEAEALKIANDTKQLAENKIQRYTSFVDKMKKGEPTWPAPAPNMPKARN